MSNKEITFTDKQWYNFICGFYAGLKLKDMTAPGYISNTVLEPISVNGSGKIGIQIGDVNIEDEVIEYDVPVFTHDVDIGYSGFNTVIKFSDSRVSFVSCIDGEFGTVGDASSTADVKYNYNKSTKTLMVRALRGTTVKEVKDPMILFFIRIKVYGVIYEDEKIPLELVSNSFTSLNSTVLLKYVLISGVPALYYITPLDNASGFILGNRKRNVSESATWFPVSKPEGAGVKASPSGVFIGSSSTSPGNRGTVPIYSNSNKDDDFPYDKVHIKITVEDDVVFKYINVTGNGWSVSVKKTTDEHNYPVLDITATRDGAFIDSSTFAYIDYEIDSTGTEYDITLKADETKLGNGNTWRDVAGGNGSIKYPPVYGSSTGGGGGGLGGWGGGGCGGGGSLWSSAGGIMWIKADGAPPYPVYLKPGWNKVYWWIPWLFPSDGFVDVTISFSPPGYILVPAGFEWWIIEEDGAPTGPVRSERVDGLKFKDSYDVDIESSPGPVDVDGNIDEVDFSDIHSIDSMTTILREELGLDEVDFSDIHSIDSDGVAVNLDELQDELELGDVYDTSTVTLNNKNTDDVDELELGDVYDTSTVTLNNIDEALDDVFDMVDIHKVDLDINSLTDVYSIEMNEEDDR